MLCCFLCMSHKKNSSHATEEHCAVSFPQLFCPLRDSGKMRKRKKGDDQHNDILFSNSKTKKQKIRRLEGAVVQVIKKSRAKQKRI